jgi:hypothetical protein
MNLFENYNTAKQKYGETLVSKLLNTQIPDEYLLSACRFYNEGVKENDLKNYFKQWAIYVKRNNTKIDVNKLSFAQFYQTIQEYKQQYGITNKVYDDGMVSIGRINSAKDIAKFPVKNDWCIKQPSMFQKYIDQGYSFYIIDNGNESNYIRYVILMISKDSAKYYYDLENEKMTQDSIAEFQSYLTQDAISFIQNLNENKEYKTNKNMTKNKIRITENELKQIVAESVKKILSEARKPSDKTVDINEAISTDYSNALKQLLAKSFSTLNENEKQFLYDLLNNEPWETIYTALNVLDQNRVY